MAIQVRRGNEADFDASKMLPGELAVSLDTRYVRMCFAPGVVLRMATYEGFESEKAQIQAILSECKDIQSAVQRIQSEVNAKASLTIEYSNSAKQSADRAYSEAERAKVYANNAEAVTEVNIATQDRAGLVKGGDNYIAEDGTLMLITATESTTMPNSYDGRLKIDEIGGGESQQDSTSGKNLLDCSGLTETTSNGVTFTPVYENEMLQYINVNGTSTAQTNYVINSGMTFGNTSEYIFSTQAQGSDSTIFAFVSTDGHLVQCNDTEMNFTPLSASTVYTCYIRVRANQIITNLKFYPMIRLASITDNTYEPYTGGIPSPNPSYPQEIKKSVVSEIWTHGNQLFDKDNANYVENLGINSNEKIFTHSTGARTYYVRANPNTTYTFSKEVGSFNRVVTCKDIPAVNDAITNLNKDTANNVATITTGANDNYIAFYPILLSEMGTISYDAVVEKAMLNVGDTALPYEPYSESVITLSQPIELYGKGDVQDVIIPKEIKRKLVYVVYDGDEYWKTSSSLSGRYYLDNVGCKHYGVVLCSQAKGIQASSINKNECWINISQNLSGRFLINTEFATVNEWKAHLAEHPMTVVYEMAEETTEELPIADQIALNSLSTFDGITYLEFDSEIEPTFKGEYGTSKVGGYTLEGMLAGRNGELLEKSNADRITALESTVVNNI